MTIDLSQMYADLTYRQRQVCSLIVRGLSNKEIGIELGIGARTVEEHRTQVYSKLGVNNAMGLVFKIVGQPNVVA